MFTVYLFILIIIIFIITHSGKNNHVKADRQEKTQKSEKRNWEKTGGNLIKKTEYWMVYYVTCTQNKC